MIVKIEWDIIQDTSWCWTELCAEGYLMHIIAVARNLQQRSIVHCTHYTKLSQGFCWENSVLSWNR